MISLKYICDTYVNFTSIEIISFTQAIIQAEKSNSCAKSKPKAITKPPFLSTNNFGLLKICKGFPKKITRI